MILAPKHKRRRGGFTLLELIVASTIFTIIASTLVMGVMSTRASHKSVLQTTQRNRKIRESVGLLQSELRASRDDLITVTVLPDGNHQLDFQTALDIGGNVEWGAVIEDKGASPPIQSMSGWSLRYSVQDIIVGANNAERALVREALDAAGVVQNTQTVTERVCAGTNNPPGFQVVQQGDVWDVTLSLEGWTTGTGERSVGFHVSTRN